MAESDDIEYPRYIRDESSSRTSKHEFINEASSANVQPPIQYEPPDCTVDMEETRRCTTYLNGLYCTGCQKLHRYPWEDGVVCRNIRKGRCKYKGKCWFSHPRQVKVRPVPAQKDHYIIQPTATVMQLLLRRYANTSKDNSQSSASNV